MKKSTIKFICISILLFLIIFINKTCYAANSNISVSSKNAKIGDTITVTISANAASWNVNLNATGPVKANGVTSFSHATESGENEKVTIGTVSYTVTGEGTINFSLSGQLVDGDYSSTNASGSASVTVASEPKEDPTPAPAPAPEQPSEKDPEPAPQPQTPKEPTFKNVNETVYVQTESVNVRGTWSASGGQYGSLKKGDSVTRTGVSSEKINGYVWSRINYNGKTAYVISSALTTTKVEVEEEPEEEEKSTNKLLKELKVEGYELSPKFDPQTTKYSLTLKEVSETEEAEDTIEITATPEDEKAKVEITGNENFKVGNNIVKITVTAEDGTARIYTITVSKTNEEGVVDSLKLSTLEISNGTLEPSFDPEITNYVITVEDPSTITAATILATVADKNITITTSETSVDENGEKIITLMLESQKDEKTGIYQITVKKPVVNQAAPTITGSSDNTIYYILGGIIGALLLLIIIIIIALKKTSDKDEDAIDTDELDDNYDYNLKGAIDEANKSYDDMVEGSNFKSQILNTDFSNIETSKISEKTRILDDFDNKDDNDFKPNVTPKKKGKHF